MISLLTYPAALGTYSPSPFCVKARHLLHASGQDWQREDIDNPSKLPYGKLPAIRVGRRVIADSANIRAYLEEEGADFDPGLSLLQKAQGTALTRMAEEHMYFIILLDRWGDAKVWPMVRDTYFSAIPNPLRGLIAGQIRRGLLKGMHSQGLGRLTATERLARIEHDLQAIAAHLGQSPFLLSDRPTGADMSIAPMLEAAMKTPVATGLSRRVADDPVLADYVARVNDALELEVPA